jgi:hypothetical protein
VLLLVAFQRWRIERCFEDSKTELGFDHRGGPHSLDKKRPYFSYTLPGFSTAGFSMHLSPQNAFWYRQRAG